MSVVWMLVVVAFWVGALVVLPIALGREARAFPHRETGATVVASGALFACLLPVSIGTELAIVGAFGVRYMPQLFCGFTPVFMLAGLALGLRIARATREEAIRRKIDARPFE